MPSLDELGLPLDVDDAVLDVGAPEDVLVAVKAEGGRRRARRHRRNAAIGMLGLALLAVPAFALLPGDDDQQVTVASEDESTTTERPSTTVAPTTTETTAVPTETTIVVAPPETATTVPGRRPNPTTAPTTTAPPLVCRNSIDPACGAFRWDPAPANQPLSASFAAAPTQAVVGEQVTFVVDWSDPDANAIDGFFSPDGVGLAAPCTYSQRYGPWTPPAPAPGGGTRTDAYTFTAAGTYTVVVSLWTGDVCDHPYASERQIQTTITVTEAPAP